MSDVAARLERSSGFDETRLGRTTSSMIWSAWADALGFISEITDTRGLRARTRGRELTETMAWTRRVGGKFGVQIELPRGCYSDDTQLRLASSRAISNHGFDIEAFAKIELTVWPSYALGGGRASKAAAAGMVKSHATWFANFYPNWTQSGGNGAAMRIQPHVYAARDLEGQSYLGDVIRNAIVTHGHPRALVGAVIHALTLGFALSRGRVPQRGDWATLLHIAGTAVQIFEEDVELASYWRPRWESETGANFHDSWRDSVDECRLMLARTEELVDHIRQTAHPGSSVENSEYRELTECLGLSEPSTRGSATATVIAATILAAALPEDPHTAAVIASLAVGTDTDTIATMAAALIGAATASPPPKGVQDLDYLKNEADRLTRIGMGHPAPKFCYPDILRWTPPSSQLEVVGYADGRPAIAGLGWLSFISEPNKAKDAAWTWARTSFGPTVLIKHRLTLLELPSGNLPRVRSKAEDRPVLTQVRPAPRFEEEQPRLFESEDSGTVRNESARKLSRSSSVKNQGKEALDLDNLLAVVQTHGFENEAIGEAIRRLVEEGTLEQMAVFIGALRAQIRKRQR